MPMNPRLLLPRATGFNPKSLPGFVYWLDASQAPTITVSTGVSEWRDAGGSSIKAIQVTGSAQPAYQTAAQNGRNAVYFDGTNDNMSLGNLSASFPTAATAIFAYKPNGNDTYSLYTDSDNNAFWAYPTGRTYIGTFKTTRLNNVASPLMPIDRGAVVAIVSSGAAYRVYVNGTLAHDVAADFGTGTNHRLGQNNLGAAFRGWLCEAIFSSSALNASQLAAAYKYLDAKWNLSEAAAPTVSNADAQDWIGRVYTNGGTVSASTASAVNTFCNAIDTAGIRDRFYRLNLFAGTGLSACLVPLYRGPTRTGTQYGNATDTNNGPFVSGDYAETGTTGGLKGNGSTKYLDTGLAGNTFSAGDRHCSAYWNANSTITGNRVFIGNTDSSTAAAGTWFDIHSRHTNPGSEAQITNNHGLTHTAANRHQLAQYTGATDASSYSDGGNKVTRSSFIAAPTASASNWFVFGINPGLAGGARTDARICNYSVGLSMTDANALAFYNAVHAFQTALTRQA